MVGTLPETAERRPLHTDGAPDAYSPRVTIPDPASIAAVLALSDERDLWQRAALARDRAAYWRGRQDGITEGRASEAAERDADWHRIASATVKLCLSPDHAELERRRWGPGGRAHFGDPRPGDYQGREVGIRGREAS